MGESTELPETSRIRTGREMVYYVGEEKYPRLYSGESPVSGIGGEGGIRGRGSFGEDSR